MPHAREQPAGGVRSTGRGAADDSPPLQMHSSGAAPGSLRRSRKLAGRNGPVGARRGSCPPCSHPLPPAADRCCCPQGTAGGAADASKVSHTLVWVLWYHRMLDRHVQASTSWTSSPAAGVTPSTEQRNRATRRQAGVNPEPLPGTALCTTTARSTATNLGKGARHLLAGMLMHCPCCVPNSNRAAASA